MSRREGGRGEREGGGRGREVRAGSVIGAREAGEGEDDDAQGVLHVFVNLHDGRLVAAAVAVVGCREDGDDVSVVRPVAASDDDRVSGPAPSTRTGREEREREGRTSPP